MERVLVYGMTDNPGGIEAYLLNLFRRVQGNQVMLDFVSDFPAVVEADFLRENGARLYFIPAKGKDLRGHWRGLRKILREHREYKTVYFNILDAGAAFTMLVPFLMRRRIVVHSHNSDTDKHRLHRLCRPWLRLMASGKVACSDEAAVFMFAKGSRSALIIPNAIDAAKYSFSPETRALKRAELGLEDRLVICHVGRLSHQKNPWGLLDIFAAIRGKCPSAILLSVGSGELREEFEARIKEKNLSDAVRCLGVRPDVPGILQAADVFLFPSFYEGLSIALLEAQAAGLPCVASDTVSRQTIVTDLVQCLPLSAAPEIWAERVLELAGDTRRNTFEDMVNAGFDISCCAEYDKKLLALFG